MSAHTCFAYTFLGHVECFLDVRSALGIGKQDSIITGTEWERLKQRNSMSKVENQYSRRIKNSQLEKCELAGPQNRKSGVVKKIV